MKSDIQRAELPPGYEDRITVGAIWHFRILRRRIVAATNRYAPALGAVLIFDDFFFALECHLYDSRSPGNNRIDSILELLFNRLYIMEFLLMNPLMTVDDTQLECMLSLRETLRPFGSIPGKIKLMLARGFETWRSLLSALKQISMHLEAIDVKFTLPAHCPDALTKMTQCQVCSGESPSIKACFSYCSNVLKGCLSELAELSPQFDFLMDSLIQLASRLKTARNPYNILSPQPFQISEAIMNFQELGTSYSNRIMLRCFPKHTSGRYRFKRDDSKALQSRRKRLGSTSEKENYYWDNDSSGREEMKAIVWDFIDMLSRLKGFWKLLPRTLCQEQNMAVPDFEQCWNGTSVGTYRRKLARSGIEATRCNPEFFKSPQRSDSDEQLYASEQNEFVSLAKQLDSLYTGEQGGTGGPAVKEGDQTIANLNTSNISIDDEDYSYEGSGDYEAYSEDYERTGLRSNQQPLFILPASGAGRCGRCVLGISILISFLTFTITLLVL